MIAALPNHDDGNANGRARETLEHLCDAYWKPLYAFARFSGNTTEDAQNLTQQFLFLHASVVGIASGTVEPKLPHQS
ncbi:MAG: hypothetical protein ED559_02510 [Phycisphaera sp.]|nr:MAG: hypothetical protein ED559_02510 [Phycisphaera sp.]